MSLKHLCPLLSLWTLIGVLVASSSATASWQSTNPGGGGAFNSPVVLSNGVWAVGSDLGGVYVSTDSGNNWIAVGASFGLTVTHISAMVAHPSNAILVGTDDGLFKIDPATRTIRQTYSGGYVGGLVVSADANRAYATVQPAFDGLEPFLLVSTDAGNSWTPATGSLPSNLRAVAMRAHPVDPLAVWVVSGEGRFASGPAEAWFTGDGGASWQRLDPQQGDVVDLAYAYDTQNLNRMFLTAERNGTGVFFVSDDTGFSWSEISPDVPGGGILPTGVLLADATSPDHVRLIDFNYRNFTSETFLWESFDGGSSWSRSSNSVVSGWSSADETWGLGSSFQGLLQTIGYDPLQPQTVLWVNSQFVYRSQDGGHSWLDSVSQQVGSGWQSRSIDNAVPIVIEVSAADPDLIYTGYMDMGLWRSDDGGDSWIDLNTVTYSGNWIGNGGNTLSVVTDPERSDVVWAQMAGDMEDPSQPFSLVKSLDRGASWTPLTVGLPDPILRMESLSLAEDSFPTARWLFVIANDDVYLSQDDGDSWERVLECGDCHKVWYTESGVFATGPSGLWRSWQGGVLGTWEPIVLPADATSGWTPNQHWLHDSWSYVGPNDLAVRDNEVWLSIFGAGKGLYYSNDWGASWSKVLTDDYLRTVEVDSSTGEVHVGSSSALQAGYYNPASAGFLSSPSGIGNWQPNNRGLAFSMVTSITVASDGQRWLISPGQGVLRWLP